MGGGIEAEAGTCHADAGGWWKKKKSRALEVFAAVNYCLQKIFRFVSLFGGGADYLRAACGKWTS